MNTYVLFLESSQDLPSSFKRLPKGTSVFIRVAADMTHGAAYACNVSVWILVQRHRDKRPHKLKYES
jgi:hypothetical protein